MSEVSDIFDFREESDGLDIDAIFGETDGAVDPLPMAEEQKPKEQSDAGSTAPQTAEEENVTVEETARTNDGGETEAEQDLFSVFAEEKEAGKQPHPPAIMDVSAEKSLSLFDKPPIFKYGSAREPIEDASMTFEELRIQKADDFPELEEGKKVSWSVKYGDVTKPVSLPKETTIAKVKEEIEKSKAFLDALKKGKVKDPECLVTPRVTAGSKGIAAYKGVYPTVEAARASGKVINLIPASDGRIYEMRKTELGEFIAAKSKIVDFSEVRAGFIPALPLIPRELMGQLISFFRSFMSVKEEFEALAFLYWDRQEEKYLLHVPRQTSGKAYVGFRMDGETPPEDRYLHYADIHSHNSMSAKFSCVDDADEKATRLYLVVGRLDRFYPEITARVSCGGSYLEIDPAEVVEGIGEEFPPEWLDRVERRRAEDRFGLHEPKMKRALEEIFT